MIHSGIMINNEISAAEALKISFAKKPTFNDFESNDMILNYIMNSFYGDIIKAGNRGLNHVAFFGKLFFEESNKLSVLGNCVIDHLKNNGYTVDICDEYMIKIQW